MNSLCRILSFSLLVLLPAMRANAHAFLEHSDPHVGGKVHSALTAVRVWFTEAIEPAFSSSKFSMRPENRSIRKTRTWIPAIGRSWRFHCRDSDQERTRWSGAWCQWIRIGRMAISRFRFFRKAQG